MIFKIFCFYFVGLSFLIFIFWNLNYIAIVYKKNLVFTDFLDDARFARDQNHN